MTPTDSAAQEELARLLMNLKLARWSKAFKEGALPVPPTFPHIEWRDNSDIHLADAKAILESGYVRQG